MSGSTNGHYVICPLCEGKGKMHRAELIARLANREAEATLNACWRELIKADGEPGAKVKTRSFHEEVVKGPITRILWRRSSKE